MGGYLFSFHGRTGRVGYWMFGVLWALIWAAFIFGPFLIMLLTQMPFAMPLGGMGIIFMLLAMWLSSFAITVRRLHDIDLSGWTLMIMIVLGAAVFGLEFYKNLAAPPEEIFYINMSLFGLNVFFHTFYVLLGVWPGTDGANRFD